MPANPFHAVVTKRAHPGGKRGAMLSLAEVGQRAWAARDNVLLRAWSTQKLAAAGYPATTTGKVDAIVRAFRREAGAYVSDPVNVEFMAGPVQTLCLDDEGVCLRGYDCDDAAIACIAACYAVGIEPLWAVAASYAIDADYPTHVYLGFADEQGHRHAVDPTLDDPWKIATASREWWHDPTGDMTDSDLQSGRFVGIGRADVARDRPHPHPWQWQDLSYGGRPVGLSAADQPPNVAKPHEVYEYRRIWDPYIAGTVSALRVCADAIQTQSDALAGSNASQATTLKLYADQARGNADFLVAEWNAYHDWQEWQVIDNASAILLFFQKTVLQAGAYAADSGKSCAGVNFPSPVPLDEQNSVILALEDMQLVGKGALQLLGIGSTGAIQAVGGAVDYLKKKADDIIHVASTPWPWIAVAAAAGAYVTWRVWPHRSAA